jgi:TonB family protein
VDQGGLHKNGAIFKHIGKEKLMYKTWKIKILTIQVFLFFLLFCGKHENQPVMKAVPSGDCFVFRNNGIFKISSRVENKDTIVTYGNGSVQVVFNDSDYVVISSNSKAIVSFLNGFAEINVLEGKVYSNAVVLPREGKYKIITPKLSTQIKGTAFSIEVDSMKTSINVLEGAVDVVDNDSLCPIRIEKGEMATLNLGRFPCQLREMTVKDLNAMIEWIGKPLIKLRKIRELKLDIRYLAKLKQIDIFPESLVSFKPVETKVVRSKENNAAIKREFLKTDSLKKAAIPVLKKINLNGDEIRSPGEISATIKDNKETFGYIYKKYLKQNEPCAGRILLRFQIHTNGKVVNPEVLSSSFKNPEFNRNVINALCALRFKPIQSNQDLVTIVYPLDFVKPE